MVTLVVNMLFLTAKIFKSNKKLEVLLVGKILNTQMKQKTRLND